MKIALSTDAILENIYAASALYAVTNPANERPPLLCRDQRSALVLVIEDAFTYQLLQMLSYVKGYTIADGLLTVDLSDDIVSESNPPLQLLQTIVTARTLAAVWHNFDIKRSLDHDARADAATRLLLSHVRISSLRIRRSF
jgi:hypothetical protein